MWRVWAGWPLLLRVSYDGISHDDVFVLQALSTTIPFVAAVWPYATIRSVLEAGVKPDGVIPATSAAPEVSRIKDLEYMLAESDDRQIKEQWGILRRDVRSSVSGPRRRYVRKQTYMLSSHHQTIPLELNFL